ncbi:ribonuclease H-like domain-containing protein [Tanacetum coccineum]
MFIMKSTLFFSLVEKDRLFTGDNLGLHHVCNSWIPRKVNICVWGASIERLATKPCLIARGVNMESDLCAFCEVSSESTNRCLLVCPHVKTIRRKIWGWWNFANPISFPTFDVLNISINKIADLVYDVAKYLSANEDESAFTPFPYDIHFLMTLISSGSLPSPGLRFAILASMLSLLRNVIKRHHNKFVIMSVHNSKHNTPFNSDHDDDINDSATRISKLDISDPLHLHPNDTTALTVVSIKLKRTENYQVWSCAMLLALERKNKIGFINGSCKRSNTDEVLGFKNHNQLLKLMQFLMGLDDSYMQIRSSILSRETLPDMRSAYATISSEESHRVVVGSIAGSSQMNQASDFVSNVPYSQNF